MKDENKELSSTAIIQRGSGVTSIATLDTDVSTTTSSFGSGNAELISFNFDKTSKTISVVWREQSNTTLGNGEPMPDRIWKEIYAAEGNEIVLKAVKNGVHERGYYVEETFNFDD